MFGLWWIYFDDTDATEIKSTLVAPYVWIYAHLPLTIGLTAFGVAAKKLFVSVGEEQVKYQYLIQFCVAIIFYAVALALLGNELSPIGFIVIAALIISVEVAGGIMGRRSQLPDPQ